MNALSETSKSTATSSKTLWAVIGALGVAVLAMGATLIYTQARQEPLPNTSLAPTDNGALVPLEGNPTGAKKAPVAATHNASAHSSSGTASAGANAPQATANKAVCANCGTVKSVTPIERDGSTNGTGAVAGGVLGAVVGNQLGGGSGKTLATVLGAVGGGIAGNTVEKKMKKETRYQVRVHMEDGSIRTIEQATPASVGAKVIVEGNTLQPSNR